nr:Atu4866 domain-containing protein [Actinoalloteichus hoggarensis]
MILYRRPDFSPAAAEEIEAARRRGPHRPLLLTGARILTGDPLLGDIESGDVLVGEQTIYGIGPGLLTAAADDDAIVVDCRDTVITPAVVDLFARHAPRPRRADALGTLVPGGEANLLVLADAGTATIPAAVVRLAAEPAVLGAALDRGEIVHWGGRPRRGREASPPAAVWQVDERRVGTWIDETGFLHQHLDADGRYDETRGGREHAFQGRYRIDGDRIDYQDDLGFWAFGTFTGDVLHHAGYTLRRRP